MRTTVTLGMVLLALVACESPDPSHDGFVLVDHEARAAGIEIDVSGERHEGQLPVTVPDGAEATLIRPDGEEPLLIEPGELIQIVGPNGEIQRGSAPRDTMLVDGDDVSVRAFAEMIGATADRLPDGSWTVSGPDAFILATLMGGMADVQVRVAPPVNRPDVVHVDLFLNPLRGTSPVRAQEITGAVPEAASLVGLYQHQHIGLLLDAAGGYTLYDDGTAIRQGTFRPRPGGVEFIPADGGEVAVMALSGEQLVDDLGVDFAP